jgi:hypothetical protein
MVAVRHWREIAEMYFLGQKLLSMLHHLAPPQGAAFCDKDRNLKLGGL